jgi:hypothetical protein
MSYKETRRTNDIQQFPRARQQLMQESLPGLMGRSIERVFQFVAGECMSGVRHIGPCGFVARVSFALRRPPLYTPVASAPSLGGARQTIARSGLIGMFKRFRLTLVY